MNDPIGDMLTRIRNGQMRGKSTVSTPASKLRGWVLDVLADEGYIRGYEATTGADGHPALEISLKYFEGTPVIRELKRASMTSQPSVRAWVCRLSPPPKVGWLTQARAPTMLAAKCFARSSKEKLNVSYW